MLIDTHAHLDDEQYDEDRNEVIQRALDQGIEMIINMGADIASSRKAAALAATHDMIYAGVGIHPEEVDKVLAKDEYVLADLVAENKKVLAIGEIGLDYHFRTDNRDLQKKVFIKQLDLARQLKLPVSIHDRDAHGDLMEVLRKEGRGIRGVIHCYSGSAEMAKELLKLGWYLGVDGPLTFKNAAKLPEIIKTIPLERLLLETDSPYLAPVPKRGTRNEPSYVRYTAQKVAELRNIEYSRIAQITTANAKTLFLER
ncbi:TatD family hydrolase [Pectinatus cerevisiiphilus]|uniref:TatD DNase family protein n=1 Tax=Pectinatus cerevisiiphilus TaxID=86956 RepID=A0A4R3K241_9FIRM|nr:TatD family hydrolase [Pectinatus cerevisiiphilus]TCS76172.1 TatD DNase family protein [Pectinatus cerevisiiphilus]